MIQTELDIRPGEVSILFAGGLHGRDTQTLHRRAELAILRRHLLVPVDVSDLCDE
jgi:hypothetical protein